MWFGVRARPTGARAMLAWPCECGSAKTCSRERKHGTQRRGESRAACSVNAAQTRVFLHSVSLRSFGHPGGRSFFLCGQSRARFDERRMDSSQTAARNSSPSVEPDQPQAQRFVPASVRRPKIGLAAFAPALNPLTGNNSSSDPSEGPDKSAIQGKVQRGIGATRGKLTGDVSLSWHLEGHPSERIARFGTALWKRVVRRCGLGPCRV